MSDHYYTLMTSIGLAKLAQAEVTGQRVNITHMAVGDANGTAYEPSENLRSLKNECWRAPIAGRYRHEENDHWIVTELIVPVDVGGFTVREVGLFDADGDMIAVGNYPPTVKPQLQQGIGKDLTIRMINAVSNVATVELSLDRSSALATREYVRSIAGKTATLDGPQQVAPGETATYHITNYSAWDTYTVETTVGSVTLEHDQLTLTVPDNAPPGNESLTLTRNGYNADNTYQILVSAEAVARPTLTAPSNNANGLSRPVTLESTPFTTYPANADTQAAAEWEIAQFGTVVWTSGETSTDLTTIEVPENALERGTEYHARVRHLGENLGASPWSPAVTFTTAQQYLQAPVFMTPQNGATDLYEQPILELTSAVSVPAGVFTHTATQWQIANDPGFINLIWDSGNDSTNLTSIAVPAGYLQESTQYYVRARFIGTPSHTSEWSQTLTVTTASVFVPTIGEPFGGGFFAGLMLDESGEEYALIVSPKAEGDPGGTMRWQDAIDFVATVSAGGHTDWKLPDIDEKRVLYKVFKPTNSQNSGNHGATNRTDPPLPSNTTNDPTQTTYSRFWLGASEAFEDSRYWSMSVGSSSSDRISITFESGYEFQNSTSSLYRVRAVRRMYV
ncbi:MAG: phage tail protein [Halomonas sp.]|nr:phage tail protein [Halomonas sp.]MBL1266254.1 phage tail protein [Halomonas sp.]